MNKAETGTIIHATMRPQDVIPALMDTLYTLDPKKYQEILESADSGYMDSIHCYGARTPLTNRGGLVGIAYLSVGATAGIDLCDDDPWWDSEDCSEFLNCTLWDALNEYAPPYCYFGAHEGDGSDYGFWPSWDYIEDCAHDGSIKRVSDLSEVPDDYTGDVCIVNDHGNMTVGHHTADSCFSEGAVFKAYWDTV
jgi:hypothetical protein